MEPTSDISSFRETALLAADLGRLWGLYQEALSQVETVNVEIIRCLASAASEKDDDTGNHMERVGCMSGFLASLNGMPNEYCGLLSLAAPLHDIGKIGIPDSILKKQGGLDPHERDVMNTHTQIGANILGGVSVENPLLRLAAEVALTHHERWDGSGYPKGLKETAIPISGRIVAIIDFYDALTMDRCYRKAFPPEEVVELLKAASGQYFDPSLIKLFIRNFSHFEELRKKNGNLFHVHYD